MKINAQTKISTIIKHNKNAIDVIALINPHFNKLKNPILRRVLAPRVSIEDAARIGKCKVDDFFNALSAIGFEIESSFQSKEKTSSTENKKIMETLHLGKVKSLDVRPILDKGEDPFNHIMEVLKTLPKDYTLEVINTFEPSPLIKLLSKKGYISTVESRKDIVKTYFYKTTEPDNESMPNDDSIFKVSLEELEMEQKKHQKHCKEIDVRDLEMPLPMVTILNELEDLQEGHAIFVHHKKTPQYLLPELVERKFNVWIAQVQEGNVKLLIYK